MVVFSPHAQMRTRHEFDFRPLITGLRANSFFSDEVAFVPSGGMAVAGGAASENGLI